MRNAACATVAMHFGQRWSGVEWKGKERPIRILSFGETVSFTISWRIVEMRAVVALELAGLWGASTIHIAATTVTPSTRWYEIDHPLLMLSDGDFADQQRQRSMQQRQRRRQRDRYA